jgi:hypothetical protein
MNTPLLTFQLATNQIIEVHLSDPAERLTCENLAKYQLEINTKQAELRKTYLLCKEPTVGRGYDDRRPALHLVRQIHRERASLPRVVGR